MATTTQTPTEETTNRDVAWYEFRIAAEFNSEEAADACFIRVCDWYEELLGHGRFAATRRGPIASEEETP